ncbi:spore cortex biosynthesis protein YabQ [Desulfofarcimen acetoxidans DSM 771]|jgi:spore cortex biosynthesis protein YabQ|uniref:Spore cortex biosynthesis protein YabQ n=1 Tax=Desulfofarcimen acetoxidans (strain ATCC 49208 / DSM 771 / KCTC 5769 / VKM B-1644 / 5575) TaxID=485916 RepID=C8W320_DESAS|nr:spore cortex biosynthesis protein YabQ [Desulfofarcimen acetoxidans]ACV61176.1 spore cortex biosynthesis protein YabQ [Desulfofarcimen acetoxidans DSM 771]
MPLSEQIYAFLVIVLTGIASGFCYDFYVTLKTSCKFKKIAIGIGDLLFWLTLTALIFSLLIVSNYGEIRLYVFIALGLGLLIYFKILSKNMINLLYKLFYLIEKLWRLTVKVGCFLFKVIILPLVIIKKIIFYPLNIIVNIICKIKLLFYKAIRQILYRPAIALKSRIKKIINGIFKRKPK